ncbi:hypothetical protein FB45DRAFT_262667 [Roridomyces roridus]|uniref:Uncharacterized protein n=1 Tax=Roridomyces roridus TaxID=1738132 RepID=A0AAD7FDP6_9AGAR|nr:hypothetical protein FB45DRAFT_262667 [Roridomyces roridus]
MALPRSSLLRPFRQLLRRAHRSARAGGFHVTRTRSCQNPALPSIPELFDPDFLDALIPPSPADPQTHACAQNPIGVSNTPSQQTLTENGSPPSSSKLSATHDAFWELTYYTWGNKIGALLDKAWAEDPLLALKLIWNVRSIHEGKAQKKVFYRAFGWLYDNHPRTAIANLHLLVTPVCGKGGKHAHGYWKDLLNILTLATVDKLSNVHEYPSKFLTPWGLKRSGARRVIIPPGDDLKNVVKARRAVVGGANHARVELKLADPKYRALFIGVARLFSARLLADWGLFYSGQDRDISLAPKWAPSPLATHDRHTNISTAIARLVYHNGPGLALPDVRFPSALKDLPLESPEATDILRSYYRRWILTPLRAVTGVTVTFMSAKRWADIPYNRVSKVCMKNNEERFFRHDPEGFQQHLISLERERSISCTTLQPHELLQQLAALKSKYTEYPELKKHRKARLEANRRVIDAQWEVVVERLRRSGTIENSIAVCDVSGSMGSLLPTGNLWSIKDLESSPIFPAVSLSLLLAQLSKPPFDAGFITFSQNPRLVRVDMGKGLYETVKEISTSKAPWRASTNLYAVLMRLILPMAIENKVKPEDMIKRVFVFSNRQFDDCVVSFDESESESDSWSGKGRHTVKTKGRRARGFLRDERGRRHRSTNYEVITKAFETAGYGVPEIVFWDLRHGEKTEVTEGRVGVTLMRGFSPAMLKVVMGEEEGHSETDVEEGEEVVEEEPIRLYRPRSIVGKALAKECYDGLVVVD